MQCPKSCRSREYVSFCVTAVNVWKFCQNEAVWEDTTPVGSCQDLGGWLCNHLIDVDIILFIIGFLYESDSTM